MRAVVFAYHDMGIAGLEALRRNGFEIAAIFSHDDDPGENCWFGSVKEWGRSAGIDVFCPVDVNIPAEVGRIAALRPEAIFSFYYRRMFGREILNLTPGRAFNLHGSLLPAYRGRAPVNWVLVNGEERTGVTLHLMTEKPDAGGIVGQRAVAISETDTARTLYGKLCREAGVLLDEVLPLIREGRETVMPQDLSQGSYFGGRKPEDGRIDWRWPSRRIYNLIRAVTDPYPGAFAFFADGRKIFVWWATPASAAGQNAGPGEIRLDGAEVAVGTGDGLLRLQDVEVDGRRMRGGAVREYFKDKEGIVLT
ncbi:MAG: Bifunctional polymyxin resistance protein ArnA [Syntrophaceae bacterium PtaU1.Bin231]|nr:MAG: Bifunctional polymyxin resistance protein ArnA [Syntrophaceae bacterium PtaU1.Bin231]